MDKVLNEIKYSAGLLNQRPVLWVIIALAMLLVLAGLLA